MRGGEDKRVRGAAHAAGARSGASARRGTLGGVPGFDDAPDKISTIHAGQGARVTTRGNASEAADRARHNAEKRYAARHPEERAPKGGPRRSAGNVALIVVASILCLAVIFVLGTCVTAALSPSSEPEDLRNEQTLRPTESEQELIDEQRERDEAQEQVGVDGSVSYGGESYSLAQGEDGLWGLRNSAGELLFSVEGTPVALARSGNVLLIPENHGDGWDVVSYVIGGHLSGVTYVVGSDGEPVRGEGGIAQVQLDGTTLRVSDDTGATTDVSLV